MGKARDEIEAGLKAMGYSFVCERVDHRDWKHPTKGHAFVGVRGGVKLSLDRDYTKAMKVSESGRVRIIMAGKK